MLENLLKRLRYKYSHRTHFFPMKIIISGQIDIPITLRRLRMLMTALDTARLLTHFLSTDLVNTFFLPRHILRGNRIVRRIPERSVKPGNISQLAVA